MILQSLAAAYLFANSFCASMCRLRRWCQHQSPASTEGHPQTNRERMAEHVGNKFCRMPQPNGPHRRGLEKFDAVGARRDDYKLFFYAPSHSRKQQAEGSGPADRHEQMGGRHQGCKFSSPRELGAVLAKTPQCQECMVKQYFRYVAGRRETPADYPVIQRVVSDFRNSRFQFKELIVSLIRTGVFRVKRGVVNVASNNQTR